MKSGPTEQSRPKRLIKSLFPPRIIFNVRLTKKCLSKTCSKYPKKEDNDKPFQARSILGPVGPARIMNLWGRLQSRPKKKRARQIVSNYGFWLSMEEEQRQCGPGCAGSCARISSKSEWCFFLPLDNFALFRFRRSLFILCLPLGNFALGVKETRPVLSGC